MSSDLEPLKPFLHKKLPNSLSLVSCTLTQTAYWLLELLINAKLKDISLRGPTTQSSSATPTTSSSIREDRVVVVSLLRPRSVWEELGRKVVRQILLCYICASDWRRAST